MPLFVMVTTSLKTLDDIRTGNLLSLPASITLEAWVKAWGTACTGVDCYGLKGNFMNSVRIVVPAVLISTLIGAFNGYVLPMWRFRGSDFLFGAAAVRLLHAVPGGPAADGADPRLHRHRQSTAGLIFVHVVYGLAFTTLFFRNFYVSVPDAS